MRNTIKINKEIVDKIYAHAKEALPNESCGYLSGHDGVVQKFYPMTNVDQSPEHFSFDPKEQFAVVKEARHDKQELIAVYHSHPETPARLSEEDIKLFNDPNMTYIIVSLKEKYEDIKAFTLKKPDDNTIEIKRVEII